METDDDCDCRDCVRFRNREAGIEDNDNDSESDDGYGDYWDEEMEIDHGSEAYVEDNCDEP